MNTPTEVRRRVVVAEVGVTSASRSRTISWARIAFDPAATCLPVVADHHRPGPQRRPGTAGNADTGGRSSNATVMAASAHRCCTGCPTGSRNTASIPLPWSTPASPAGSRAGLLLCWSPAPAKPLPPVHTAVFSVSAANECRIS